MRNVLRQSARLLTVSIFVGGLAGCTIKSRSAADDRLVTYGPSHVETLGETIAREQEGKRGCLVAGNLDQGGDCEKLREFLFPPVISESPKS